MAASRASSLSSRSQVTPSSLSSSHTLFLGEPNFCLPYPGPIYTPDAVEAYEHIKGKALSMQHAANLTESTGLGVILGHLARTSNRVLFAHLLNTHFAGDEAHVNCRWAPHYVPPRGEEALRD